MTCFQYVIFIPMTSKKKLHKTEYERKLQKSSSDFNLKRTLYSVILKVPCFILIDQDYGKFFFFIE
jgi:hypothetical protein